MKKVKNEIVTLTPGEIVKKQYEDWLKKLAKIKRDEDKRKADPKPSSVRPVRK